MPTVTSYCSTLYWRTQMFRQPQQMFLFSLRQSTTRLRLQSKTTITLPISEWIWLSRCLDDWSFENRWRWGFFPNRRKSSFSNPIKSFWAMPDLKCTVYESRQRIWFTYSTLFIRWHSTWFALFKATKMKLRLAWVRSYWWAMEQHKNSLKEIGRLFGSNLHHRFMAIEHF